MRAFLFGRSEAPLFGLHHAPPASSSGRGAVVLCQPFGAEYLRAHRCMRELAARLAQQGFHVVRFDYYGTGDSAGEGEDARLAGWLDDVDTAIEEARELADSQAVSLVGMGLGATLAALAGSRSGEVRHAVLWAPVVKGARYLRELAEEQRAWLEERPRLKELGLAEARDELLGAPVGAGLRDAIERVDLTALERSPARRALVIAPEGDPEADALRVRLAELGCESEAMATAAAAGSTGDFDQQLVPIHTLQAITGWLAPARP
jgi:alpha-beta hydrolase superfamily lysophospholipase